MVCMYTIFINLSITKNSVPVPWFVSMVVGDTFILPRMLLLQKYLITTITNYYTIFGSLSRNRYGIAPHKSLWSEIMPSWQDFLSTLLAQSCIFQRKSPIYPYVLYRNGLKHFFVNADDMSDLNSTINISMCCHSLNTCRKKE